ncbi:peroxidase-related enzyme [Marinobacter qingdaonensis]|uniref:Peroxidase-related enzyme n=1 Tax=Marinobacter qingdaonensis TaxID=3108486 RepID=A0ABU5NU04_9GAMM|nr:peroxidase-related enzyme [Marinobacter sp. ASW11-75]MEA1079279.1 peroxidase-related enzyme [Marinobacter sp. ASW11-75]MEE2763129.1 peroxidase-related enzyme [Pseudomonadota bacterium]
MNPNKNVVALDLPIPEISDMPEDTQKYFQICQEKLGMIPNVLTAYSQNLKQLEGFTRLYNELMLGEGELSKLEREMIAVVVSSENKCFYCLVAHGAAVRVLSGDPLLGEHLVMNYRSAQLDQRQRAMLDYASLLTRSPATVTEAHTQTLREAGFSDRAIWDIANLIGFYNMSNRVAIASDMQPNTEYHSQSR